MIGLNFYAAREAAQGQRLKARMSQRVKQAFPELPVILNPLQQARQQIAARQSGAATDPAQRFANLVQQAGSAMPFMSGNVQALVFENGELRLNVVAEAQKPATAEDWKIPWPRPASTSRPSIRAGPCGWHRPARATRTAPTKPRAQTMNKHSLALAWGRWETFRTRLRTFWQGLAVREQAAVALAALVVGGCLVWLALIQPPLKTIAYWQAETPKLRSQTQALEVLLRDVAGPAPDQPLEAALRQSLEASGLSQHYQLQAPDAERPNAWQLTFDKAPAEAVISWLLGNPRQFSWK